MRQPVETQLRNYFEQIEETHGPLSTNVILDRSAPVQVIPESRPVTPPRRAIRKLAWAVALIVFVAVAIVLGAIDSSTPPVVDQPVTTTIPGTIPTTAPVPSTVQGPIDVDTLGFPLQPGTYYVDPDGPGGTDMTVEFTIVEPGWAPFSGAFKPGNAVDYVAVKALFVTEVASPACDSTIFVPVGDTAQDLATALAEIEDFPSQEAPTQVNVYGYDGYHLVLEVPENGVGGCDDGYFDGYQGPTIGRYYQGPGQVVEFWVLDVEGTPLLIEATWFPDSPEDDLAQLQAILDSIVIRP